MHLTVTALDKGVSRTVREMFAENFTQYWDSGQLHEHWPPSGSGRGGAVVSERVLESSAAV